MANKPLHIAGVEVHVDGDGDDVIVMLHGWPDNHRLWDATVAALKDHHRCVRFTLPGFDRSRPLQGFSLDEVVGTVRAVVQHVSPNQPVTLLLHDWGCVYGYQFAMREPAMVRRIVAVDIGDAGSRAHLASLSVKAKLMVAFYQLWLVAAWRLSAVAGEALGDRMTRFMARAIGHRGDAQAITVNANYPYDMQWTGSFGSFKAAQIFKPAWPMLYLYGKRKPFQFQSAEWLESLARQPGCAVEGFETGHWVMVQQPERFHHVVRRWLDGVAG
jgi:cis-3-alkyl-4-acyloxetan-2-one decarboxylase